MVGRSLIICALIFGVMVGRGFAATTAPDTLYIREVQVRARSTTSGSFTVDSLFSGNLTAKSVGELLRIATPVIVKDYGRGQQQSIVFRGTSAQHTSLYWNGLKINSPVVGDVDFSLLPAVGVDQLSVAPGVSAIGYGDGALGGVVDMQSRADWSRQWGVDVVGGVGSFSSYSAAASVRATLGGVVQSSTKFVYDYSLNDFEFENPDIIDPQNPTYRPVQTNTGADYRNMMLGQDIFVRLPQSQNLMLSVMVSDNWRNLPQLTTYEGAENSHKTNNTDQALHSVAVYRRSLSDASVEATLGFSHQRNRFHYQSLVDGERYVDYINSQSEGNTVQGRAKYTYTGFVGSQLFVEVVGLYQTARSEESVRGVGFVEGRGEYSVLGGWDSKWGNGLSSVLMGRGAVCGGEWYGTASGALNYSLGGGSSSLYLRVGYNQHYPSLSTMYYTPGGNPDLLPERGVTTELGANLSRWGITTQTNLYWSYIHDWIIWLPTSAQYWTPQNLREVMTLGVEMQVSGEWNINKDWRISAVGNITVSRTVSAGEPLFNYDYAIGQQLPFVPLVSGAMSLKTEWRNIALNYTMQGETKKYSAISGNSSTLNTISPIHIHNLTLSYNCLKIITINLECRNILNQQFYGILRRPTPPRSIMVGVGLKIAKNGG